MSTKKGDKTEKVTFTALEEREMIFTSIFFGGICSVFSIVIMCILAKLGWGIVDPGKLTDEGWESILLGIFLASVIATYVPMRWNVKMITCDKCGNKWREKVEGF